MNSTFIPFGVSVFKRLFDVVTATIGVVATAPLIPFIALAIRLDSRGPVLYRQLRVGRAMADRTELFWMYKFRSMAVDAEAKSGAVWAGKNDPRVTRIGRFMRKTRLDEIPQLLNVLRGDMSLIGPRPERPGFYGKLETAIPFFAERTYGIRPGITGLAQVYQGYDQCLDDVRAKVSYDHAYAMTLARARTWLSMDLLILWKTLGVVVGAMGQ